jgi:hypothetical protein
MTRIEVTGHFDTEGPDGVIALFDQDGNLHEIRRAIGQQLCLAQDLIDLVVEVGE